MRLIIAGSRSLEGEVDTGVIASAVNCTGLKPTEIVCGGAKGVDAAGKVWAESVGIPVKMFHADWSSYGKAAGMIRNEQMAEYADVLLTMWDGRSSGTLNMVKKMYAKCKPVHKFLCSGGKVKGSVILNLMGKKI